MQSWQFNPNQQYAFLRKADDELLLVVANFSDDAVHCGVLIPRHAFDFLKIAEKNAIAATDLLTGETLTTNLLHDSTVEISINAFSGRVLKFSL